MTRQLSKRPDLQPRRALELALGQLRRQLRIDAALPALAEEVRRDDHAARLLRIDQLTALLDEDLADRRFAVGRRLGLAVARRLEAEARRHELSEHMRGGAPAQVG